MNKELLISIVLWSIAAVFIWCITELMHNLIEKYGNRRQDKFIKDTMEYIIKIVNQEREINEHKIVMKRLINEPYVITFEITKKKIKPYEYNCVYGHGLVRHIVNGLLNKGFTCEWIADDNGGYKIFIAA